MRIRLAAMGKPEDGASGAPRLFYGWVIVLALCWTEVTSWGILYYAFPVFVTPMSQDLGWSRAAITGAFSLALLCSGLAALVVGRWVDRHGPRLIMTAGSGAAVLLVLAWSAVDDLAVFYLVWAGIGLASGARRARDSVGNADHARPRVGIAPPTGGSRPPSRRRAVNRGGSG